jgi:hypothetical protein
MVQPERLDRDQHLVVGRYRVGQLGDGEHLWAAEGADGE